MQKAADGRRTQLPVPVLPPPTQVAAAAPAGEAQSTTTAAADGSNSCCSYIKIKRQPSNPVQLLQKDPRLLRLLKHLAWLRIGQVRKKTAPCCCFHAAVATAADGPGPGPHGPMSPTGEGATSCHSPCITGTSQLPPLLHLPHAQILCILVLLVLCGVALGSRRHTQAAAAAGQQQPDGGHQPRGWLGGQKDRSDMFAHCRVSAVSRSDHSVSKALSTQFDCMQLQADKNGVVTTAAVHLPLTHGMRACCVHARLYTCTPGPHGCSRCSACVCVCWFALPAGAAGGLVHDPGHIK
jgi:hypothetical protein